MVIKENDIRGLRRLKSILANGGVSILPAFTLYGFSAHLFDRLANLRIFRLKHRQMSNPLIVIASKEFILSVASNVDYGVLSYLLDSGITVVVQTALKMPSYASKNGKTAFREANTELLRYLCRFFPITSTSINISGKSSINDVKTILSAYRNKVDIVAIGKTINMVSSVVELSGGRVRILREGCCHEKLGGIKL